MPQRTGWLDVSADSVKAPESLSGALRAMFGAGVSFLTRSLLCLRGSPCFFVVCQVVFAGVT